MGEKTAISWTHHTFNTWWGCQRVSPGCENCYAESLDARYNAGDEHWGPKAPRRFFGDKHWKEPLKWDREAAKAGERRRVFCASMADVFEARNDLDPWRARLWKLIEATPNLDWLLLSKRPENFRRYLPWLDGCPACGGRKVVGPSTADLSRVVSGPEGAVYSCFTCQRIPPNIWLGVTAEDQKRLDERASILINTPAAVRFLSCEPLLGPLDLGRWVFNRRAAMRKMMYGGAALNSDQADDYIAETIDWVIVGDESAPAGKRRVAHVDWVASIRDQCEDAGVAFHFKQWCGGAGGRISVGEDEKLKAGKIHLPLLDGRRWAEFPND